MSFQARRENFEKSLGVAPIRKSGKWPTLHSIQLGIRAVEELLEKWKDVDEEELPRLLGLTIAPNVEGRSILNIFLETDPDCLIVRLEAEISAATTIPSFSRVWPYSSWWQEELSVFCQIRFAEQDSQEGVRWRLA